MASLVVTRVWERQRAIEEQHRQHKLPIYEEFIAFWFRALMHEQTEEDPPSDVEMARFLSDFTQRLTLWGSEEVLREYGQFRLFSSLHAAGGEDASDGSTELMFKFEQLLLAIRNDLGHSNNDLVRGDLLRLWINDIDDFLLQQGARDLPLNHA